MSANELWKPVVGFEDKYEISNKGRVFSKITNKVLIPVISQHDFMGYYRVTFRFQDGKPHSKAIHRMVAEAFIPNPNKLPCVNHIDGNKLNNNVDNLEWCTKSYNSKHAFKCNLNGYKDKFFNKALLATNRKVLVILEDLNDNKLTFKSCLEASKFLGVSPRSVLRYAANCYKAKGKYNVYTFNNNELVSIANGELEVPKVLSEIPWEDFIIKDKVTCNDYPSEGE